MFDSVSREIFNMEHDARIKAEAQIEFLQAEVTRLGKALDSEREASRQERKEFLDRISPLPKDTPEVGPATAMTLAQAMNLPAIGRSQILDKRDFIETLRAKENDGSTLTMEEQGRI